MSEFIIADQGLDQKIGTRDTINQFQKLCYGDKTH